MAIVGRKPDRDELRLYAKINLVARESQIDPLSIWLIAKRARELDIQGRYHLLWPGLSPAGRDLMAAAVGALLSAIALAATDAMQAHPSVWAFVFLVPIVAGVLVAFAWVQNR